MGLRIRFQGDGKIMPHTSPIAIGACCGRWKPGTTEALFRAYEGEGLDRNAVRRDGHPHSWAIITGRTYLLSFENLRPSTKYEVRWSCRNILGESKDCEPTYFTTDST